ncbi:MAG: methyltransferase domain-containing protein [Candidatus Dojkabacteria bacterium]|nr:methyltransferase domain-containing protein [Candidatus Dojkabacteria bacterium]MDQ7021561.1 methyltransferase domain-containing protein [Candidatus Dojkabacteria bacterium]
MSVLSMEERLSIYEKVDIVFSIYALGWSFDLEKTLKNIKSYLKPNGKFIFSWEHPMYSRFEYQNNVMAITKSYNYDGERFESSWVGTDGVYIQHRKISTWVNALTNAGFTVRRFKELEAEKFSYQPKSNDPNKYYSKVRAKLITPTMFFECVLK